MFKSSGRLMTLFALLAAAYIAITLLIPPDPSTLERFAITAQKARVLSLSIVIPLIAIWYAAFYGVSHLQQYARLLGRQREGQAYRQLANGLTVLALSLPVTSITSTLLNYISRQSPHLMSTTIIWKNYISISLTFTAFWLIYRGARQLTRLAKTNQIPKPPFGLSLLYMVFSGVYLYLVFSSPIRQFANEASDRAVYYLPDALLFLTITLPYLIAWGAGLLGAYYLVYYGKNVKGLIYKRFLRYLAIGVVGIIASSIVVQVMSAVSLVFAHLTLARLLMWIYLILIVMAIGYLMVARGANQLKKIEEV